MSVIRRVPFFLVSFPVSWFSVSEKGEKVERQRARRLRRHVIALGAVLTLGSLRSWPQEPPPGGPAVTLGIEVGLPDRSVFYIPVVGDGEMPGIVPLSRGRFAGIRITPRMRADSVHIEVSALTTAKQKLSEATYDELRSWNGEDAGSYDGKENVSLLLSGLAGLGLPAFEVKVVPVHGPPPGGFHHPYANSLAYCGCEFPKPRSIINPDGSAASGVAGIMSYPDAGKCAQISGCGQCCRITFPTSVQQASMTPDQVNTAGWTKAWANLVNDAEQTFAPSVPRLLGVEVELVVGNAGAVEDQLTLTVLDETGRALTAVTENVQTADCDHATFVIPKGGIDVTPGQSYRLKLSGGTTFGWKYVSGGYEMGAATFNGRPLLPDVRSTFLFRTFGAKQSEGYGLFFNSYASGAESRRMMLVRSGTVKYRIAMWASAGFLVAGFWALFAFATFPATSERMRDVWTLVSLTCPIAIAGLHSPISLYEVLAANAVTYALVGLIVEMLRHQLHHAE